MANKNKFLEKNYSDIIHWPKIPAMNIARSWSPIQQMWTSTKTQTFHTCQKQNDEDKSDHN